MYHVIGQLLSTLIGFDLFTPFILAAVLVLEYYLTTWNNLAGPIFAIVSLIVGLLVGLLVRRLYNINVPTARFMYDVPAFVRTPHPRLVKKTTTQVFCIYICYMIVSLLPLLLFFMCDMRIDTDVIRVSAKYILLYCLDVRRYISTEYYPLGLAMSGIICGAALFLAIILESRMLLGSISRTMNSDYSGLQRRIFHTVIIYGSALLAICSYVIYAMLLRLDILWIYICTLITTIACLLIMKRVVLSAVIRLTGNFGGIRVFRCCLCWPCFRELATNVVVVDDGSSKKRTL